MTIDTESTRARAALVAQRLRRSSTVRRVVEDDVTDLCDEVDRLHRWISHIAAYPDEFSPAVKAAREALAGFDTKPEWRYAE